MKKLFFALLILISSNLFSQDWDEDTENKEHRNHNHDEYKKDYFTLGLFTGSYIGSGRTVEANQYINSISTEIEYFKFTDLSIYVRGLYRFSNYGGASLSSSDYKAYTLVVGFGGKYYVRKKGNVKPYLQIGLNQQSEYVNYQSRSTSYSFRYFMNFGIGFTVKLSRKFDVDIKYDLNKSLDKEVSYSFLGFSVLAGIKYNL